MKDSSALPPALLGRLRVFWSGALYEEAKEAALAHLEIFGQDNYFLELQDHGIADQKKVNQMLLRLSQETGIPLIATNDCHYTYAQDAEAHDVLLCLQTGKKLSDENRMRYEGGQYYVKSPEEMEALFPYAKEALENTHRIARRCAAMSQSNSGSISCRDLPCPRERTPGTTFRSCAGRDCPSAIIR